MPKQVNPFTPEADEAEGENEIKNGDLIWGRQPGEPNLWFDRFTKYRVQGPRRSLYALYTKEPAKDGAQREKRSWGVPSSWRKQAQRWRWEERAEAWDQAERDNAAIALAKQRQKLIEDELEVSTKILDKAREMMVYSLAVKTSETKAGPDGRTTIINTLNPVRWTMGDAARLLKAGSEIGRLATGLATSIEEHRNTPQSSQQMSDDELAAIVARWHESGAGNATKAGDATDVGTSGADASTSGADATDTGASGADITGAA